MKKLILLLGCCLWLTLPAAALCVTNQEISQMMQAYGFVYGQNYTLDKIKACQPALAAPVAQLKYRFMGGALGEGWKAIENTFRKEGAPLEKLSAPLVKELDGIHADIFNDISNARLFLQEVEQRCRGKAIPDDILHTLLLHNPRYLSTPADEFLEGWTSCYRTRGQPKALGLELTFDIPRSWKSKEGRHPHVVQTFSRNYGQHYAHFNFVIEYDEALKPYSLGDYLEVADPASWLPEGSRVLSRSLFNMEKLPFFFMNYENEQLRMDIHIHNRAMVMLTLFNGYVLTISGSVSTFNEEPLQENTVQGIFSLMKLMANSLVIHDLYR